MSPRIINRLQTALAGLHYRIRALGRRRRMADDVDEELRHHLALRLEREAALGASAADAERATRLRFGNVVRIREECREASRFTSIESVAHDVSHGIRLAVRNPVFSSVTVLILALGIGINVWLFSTMSTLLFGPIPGIATPDRLVSIGRTDNGASFDTMSYPNAEALAARNTSLDGLAVYAPLGATIGANEHTERVPAQMVSANYFRVLGVPFDLGRGFADEDDLPGARTAIVSARIWQQLLDGVPSLDNATIVVNRTPMQVVGVVASTFRGLATGQAVDVWLPLGGRPAPDRPRIEDDAMRNRAAHWLQAVGRLKPGVTLAAARTEIANIGADLATEFPVDNAGTGISVVPLHGFGPATRATLIQQWVLLTGTAALVLLVVCLNVANLLLARAAARVNEMVLRLSLGAGRLRLIRQLIAEHAVLGLAGAVGGALVAWWASGLFRIAAGGLAPATIDAVAIDGRVLAFTVLVTLVSSAIFSIPPAMTAARTETLGFALAGPRRRVVHPARVRRTFAVLQVALSLTLLVGAGLLGRSFQRALEVDLGFTPRGVVTAYYDLQAAGKTAAEGAVLHQRLLEQLRQHGAVDDAALGQHSPLQGSSLGLPIDVLGEAGPTRRSELVRMNVVTSAFFRTLGTPMVSGREFMDADSATSPAVVVVNETCARRCFDGGDPIGRELLVFRETRPRRIVGVVRDSKYSQPLEDVRPTIFVPLSQAYSPRMALIVRTATPAAFMRMVGDAVRRVDATVPVYDVMGLDDRLARALWLPRLLSTLVGGFSALTLLLATLGVYGIVSQSVEGRRSEIAVRMAIGAGPGTILVMVMRQGALLVATGAGLGLTFALALSGTLKGVLYGVQPLDATSFVVGVVVLAATTLAACLIPARQAASANPAAVLRQ